MSRTARASLAGICYHVINRGNAQAEVFHNEDDYAAFVRLVAEAALRECIARGSPYGSPLWQRLTARRLGLESSLRPRGREAFCRFSRWIFDCHSMPQRLARSSAS